MFMGSVGAIGNGISMALMTLEISSIHLEEPKSPTKLLMKFLRADMLDDHGGETSCKN